MKIKHLFLLLTAGVLLASSAAYLNVPTEVQAARYSNSEAKQVIKFQKAYKDLDTINYDQDTLYLTQPNFANPLILVFLIQFTSIHRWIISTITGH